MRLNFRVWEILYGLRGDLDMTIRLLPKECFHFRQAKGRLARTIRVEKTMFSTGNRLFLVVWLCSVPLLSVVQLHRDSSARIKSLIRAFDSIAH